MPSSNPSLAEANQQRQLLRKEAIAAREALAAATHAAWSEQVQAHVLVALAKFAPGVLGFCWPYRAEFDARGVVAQLLKQGWRVCLPVVDAVGAPLVFREWTPQTPMQADRYGIQTPQTGALVHPDVLLLPFNALDKQGYRLGYGAGYFDRTLEVLRPRPHVIGVGFSVGLVDTIYPQPHDIPVDFALTELGLM